jgi:hypothetical protein
MKSEEKDIVYGRKHIKFVRGGRAHNLFSKGICCFIEFAIHRIEDYKGSIFDPDVDLYEVDCLRRKHLDTMYSRLTDLDDALWMSLNLYSTDDYSDMSIKRNRWLQRYNEIAKEFSRVHNKTKVKVFNLWWLDA